MTQRNGTQGFSLIEIAIVLVIIAIVTGMAVSSGVSVLATARQSATLRKIKTIEGALLAFRVAQDRIPCPASLTIKQGSANYGVEAAVPGTCSGGTPAANFTSGAAAEGAVPVVTLGLPADFMNDGWGNRFRYAVDIAMTTAGSFSATPLGASCGPITLNDASGAARSSKAMYAIISHGANGHGAYTPNSVTVNAGSVNAKELINCHCNSSGVATSYSPTYVQMNSSRNPANAFDSFDDIVASKERWQLRTDSDQTGGTCTTIYVSDYHNNRVQKFDATGNYLGQFGGSGSGNGQFQLPMGIALDSSGNIWVADAYNYRLQEFDNSGAYLTQIGGYGWGGDQYLYTPQYVAIDTNGTLWITDSGNQVREYNTGGTKLYTFGSTGTGDSQFDHAAGIAFDASGKMLVVDPYSSDRLEKFDSGGSYLSQFGGPPGGGSGDGQLNYPQGVAIDANGNIWVVDAANHRIEKFDSTGAFLLKFGGYGQGNGQFYYPEGIAIDSGGNVWVADTQNNRVQKFDNNGNYLSQFGTPGSGNGQFDWAWGIAVSR